MGGVFLWGQPPPHGDVFPSVSQVPECGLEAGFPGPLAASYGRVLSFVYTFNFVLYFLERQVAFSDSDPDDILVKA